MATSTTPARPILSSFLHPPNANHTTHPHILLLTKITSHALFHPTTTTTATRSDTAVTYTGSKYLNTAEKLAAFRRYYAQLRAASVTSTKLKLVVIGWGEHGKTSLVLRLKELESPGAAPSPLPTRSDRTIGIEMTILQDTFVVHDFGAFQLLCNPPTRRAYEPLRPP